MVLSATRAIFEARSQTRTAVSRETYPEVDSTRKREERNTFVIAATVAVRRRRCGCGLAVCDLVVPSWSAVCICFSSPIVRCESNPTAQGRTFSRCLESVPLMAASLFLLLLISSAPLEIEDYCSLPDPAAPPTSPS